METCDNSWSPCLPVAYGMAICNFKVSEFFVGLETPSFEDNANNEDKSQSNSPNSATEPPAIPLNEKKFPKLDQLKLFMVDLMIGDIVQMLEAHASGWTRGYVFIGGQPTLTPILGLFPTTFIQPCILPTFENLYQRLCNFTRHEHYSESELMIRSQEREPNERIAASMSSTLNLEEKRVKPHRDIRFSSQLDIIQFVSHYYGSQAYLTEDNLNSPKPVLPPPLYPCFEKTIGPLGALIDASTAALRDWYSMIYKCLKIQNYVRMHTAKKHFFALLELRKTILLKNEIYTERNHFNGSSPVIDHVLVANFQKSVIKTIEEGNGALNLHHSLLAEDGSIVTNSNHSLLFMKDMYEQMDNRLSLAESNESPNAARRKSINNETEPSAYHVYMDLKSSLPALSSQYYSTEFRFSIFSKRNNSYITDDHVLIVEETFGQDSRSPLEDLRCLFMDFSVEETTHKLFLVCRVVRNGPLKESETHSKIICRRPLAVGFLEINDIFNSRDGSNLLPYQFRLFEHTNDQSFNALLNDLINKSNSCIPLKCEPISLMLRCYTELPTPLGTAITVIEQTNLSEPLNPLVERNSIYLTLESGEFLKTLGKSFEVSLQVRNESHEPLMDAFRQHKGQSSSSEFFFTVFYHTLNPKWNETVRIDLPTPISHESDFSKLYFFFLIRSCSKSAIDKNDRKVAMGFMPFFDVNGAVISSQTTSLTLYKYDKKVETSYTSNHLELPKLLLKDTLNFSISLVSTHHTQSTALVNFLRPEYLLQSSLEDKIIYLTDLKSVQSSELVKFSIPLIYALMRLICEAPLETPPMISSLVFDNILNLLLLVYYDRNPRFNLYRQVIQEHIESNLKLEAAYYNLIQSMQVLIQEVRENSKNIESIRKLQFMFKSITHFVRIIVRCGALLKANPSPTENTSKLKSGFTWSSYIETLKSFLDSITSIMTDSLDHLSAIQQLAFVNFSGAFLILKESFEVHELVDRIILFTDASGSQRGSMVQKKLTFISAIVKSDLITGEIEAFFKLSSAVLRWVGDYIGWWDHTSSDTALRAQVYNECVSILCELLTKFHYFRDQSSTFAQFPTLVLKIIEGLPSLYIVYKDFVANSNPSQGLPQRPNSIFLMTTASTETSPSTNFSSSMSALDIIPPQITIPRVSPLARPSSAMLSTTSTNSNTSVSTTSTISVSSNYASPVKEPTASPDKLNVAAMLMEALNLLSSEELCHQFQIYFREQGEKRTIQFLMQLTSLIEMLYIGRAFASTWLNFSLSCFSNLIKFYHAVHFSFKNLMVTNTPIKVGSLEYELQLLVLRTYLMILNSELLQSQWNSQVWRCAFQFEIHFLILQAGQLLESLWQKVGYSTSSLPSSSSSPSSMSSLPVVTPDSTTSDSNDKNACHAMIPSLLSYIIELSMSPQSALSDASFRVLFSMMQSEFETGGNINQIEFLCMDCLDHLILHLNKGGHEYRTKLIRSIFSLMNQSDKVLSSSFKTAIGISVENLNVFLTLLITLSELPRGLEYEDEQSSGIYKLAKFMKQIGRNDYFLKYIHYLAKKQVTAQNLVEAGWTLKLHSDMLRWSDTLLPPIPELGFRSSQKECQRKEQLLLEISSHFEEGKAWENAIETCKELAHYYEKVAYDYVKQSENLQTMARLYACIAREERCYSEYFRVGYYGMGFPASIRNKQFVYRGHEWEKIGPFCERIQSKHADSVLLKSNAPPGPEILNSDMRYLQISAVQPEPDVSKPFFSKGDVVPESIRKYYEANQINRFSVTRPFRRGNKTENEFLCLWTEKTTFVTEESFPHVLRRSEVIDYVTTEYSPIENAVQAMLMKNKDLMALEKKYEKFTEPQPNCNPLTMCINGAVDAPVNGGVPMYKKAFIKSNFVQENPDKQEWVKKLETSIDEQVIILDRCLNIHSRVVPIQMRPLHDTIVNFFIKNFAEEIERLGLKPQVTPTTYSTTPENEPLFPYLPKKEDRFSRSHHWSRLSHARSFREKNRSIQSEEIPSQHSTLHTSSSSLSLKRANDFLGKIRGPSETKGTPS